MEGKGQGSGGGEVLDSLVERQRVFNEFIVALAGARLADAKAMLAQAMAAVDVERARMLEGLCFQMELEYRRVDEATRRHGRAVREVRRQAKFALALLKGTQLAAYRSATDPACRRFLAGVMASEGLAIVRADDSQLPLVRGSDFIDNHSPGRPCEDPPDLYRENAATLLDWTLSKQYVPRLGSRAYREVLTLFQAMANVAFESVREIENHLQKLREGTYKIWDPVRLAGMASLSTTSEQLKVLQGGIPDTS